MTDIVTEAYSALRDQDWEELRPLLHPYLHWTTPDGSTVRGRTRVLALLRTRPTPGPPARTELRDDQIYRWIE